MTTVSSPNQLVTCLLVVQLTSSMYNILGMSSWCYIRFCHEPDLSLYKAMDYFLLCCPWQNLIWESRKNLNIFLFLCYLFCIKKVLKIGGFWWISSPNCQVFPPKHPKMGLISYFFRFSFSTKVGDDNTSFLCVRNPGFIKCDWVKFKNTLQSSLQSALVILF